MKELFLDVETSGLTPRYGADLVEVAIVDAMGNPVFHSLAKPPRKVPRKVIEVHGITNEDVANAPSSEEVREQVYAICRDRPVGIFNAAFDLRFLPRLAPIAQVFCMMRMTSERLGVPRISMSAATAHFGLEWPEGEKAHRAGADALMLSRLYRALREQGKAKVEDSMRFNGATLEVFRNRRFKAWSEVPQGLATRTQLKKQGMQPGGVCFAIVEITRGVRYRIGSYPLFKLSEAIPIRT